MPERGAEWRGKLEAWKVDSSSFNLGETECVRGQGSALEAVAEEPGGVSQRSKVSLRQEEEPQPQAEGRGA